MPSLNRSLARTNRSPIALAVAVAALALVCGAVGVTLAPTPAYAQSSSSTRAREREKAREKEQERRDKAAADAERRRSSHRSSDIASRLDTTLSVAAGTTIDVSMTQGSITVRGWDRQSVAVHATSESGTIEFDYHNELLRLSAVSQSRGHSNNDAVLEVQVPRGSRVITYGATGDINIIDVGGDAEARTARGDVTMRGMGRRTIVEAMTGDLNLTGAQGSVRVTTLSGSLALRDVRGDVDVSCTSGDVSLIDIQSSSVRVGATTADISFSGTLASNGHYDFTTHSGTVNLTLPESASGTFDVQSFSGELHSRFPLTLMPSTGANRNPLRIATGADHDLALRRRQRLEFGGGNGAAISVTTFNGDINIERGNGRKNN